jgi:hypothetical protein
MDQVPQEDPGITVSRGRRQVEEYAMTETPGGFERGAPVGEMLCDRLNPKDPADRYTVRPWDPNPHNLQKKGLRWLATGRRGPDGNWEPLLRQAAKNHPDRAEEFLAAADQCRQNIEKQRIKAAIRPPSAEEQRTRDMENMAAAIAEGVARAKAAPEPEPTPAAKAK